MTDEQNSLQSTTKSDKKRGRPSKVRTSVQSSAPIGAPLNDDSRANRPKRVPMGSQRRLAVPERPGFVRRWFNDVDDRIERAKRAGYAIVTDPYLPIGDQRSKDAAPMSDTRRVSVGRGTHAYLMEIPKDWYEADQRAKLKRNEEKISAMKRINKEEGQYGSISVESKLEQTE
jgi:hypothetical protein